MAAYRPLVRIDGETHVLPDEDRVPVAAIEGAVADDDARLTDAREWAAETVGQAEAEARTATTRRAWTAERVGQAIVAWWGTVGTTVGKALLNLTNPSAISFLRVNADNSVTARNATDFRADIGANSATNLTTGTLPAARFNDTAHGNRAGGALHALATGSAHGFFSSTDFTKLAGIAPGATANQTDAYLLSRTNHTGTQAHTTITGLGTAATANIVTSVDDPSPGRLLTVGYGGLNVPISVSDFSTIEVGRNRNVLFSSPFSATDRPPTSANYSSGIAFGHNVAGGYESILVTGAHDGETGGALYLRNKILGDWQPWRRVIDSNQLNQSFTDITGGRVLTVGYHGLGAVDYNNDTLVTDLTNPPVSSGFYFVGSSATGNFTGTTCSLLVKSSIGLRCNYTLTADTGITWTSSRNQLGELGGWDRAITDNSPRALLLPGPVSSPTYSYAGDSDTGVTRLGANTLGLITGAVERVSISLNGLNTSVPISFTGGSAGTNAVTTRTNLGLGTAATADVTTSTDDKTTGRVLKVSDYGFGNSLNISNYNTLTISASSTWFFSSSFAPSNAPPTGSWSAGIAWRQRLPEDYETVIASVATPEGKLYTKNKDNGTWNAWREIYTSSSTVAITAGGTGANTAEAARTNLGAASTAVATTSANGLMSVADKTKLDNAAVTNGSQTISGTQDFTGTIRSNQLTGSTTTNTTINLWDSIGFGVGGSTRARVDTDGLLSYGSIRVQSTNSPQFRIEGTTTGLGYATVGGSSGTPELRLVVDDVIVLRARVAYLQTSRPIQGAFGSVTEPSFSFSGAPNSGIYYTFANNTLRFAMLGTNVANLTPAGQFSAVSLTETSSLRHKDNIEPYTLDLDDFAKLNPVRFLNKKSQKSEIGFIAEEMHEAFPEFVGFDSDGEIDSINYGKITAVLTAKIQDQDSRIKELEDKINHLMSA